MFILEISSFTTAITQAVSGAIKRLSKQAESTSENSNGSPVEFDTFKTDQENRNEKYKAQLKELSIQKAELITKLLGNTGTDKNAPSEIRAELAKIEAKGAILREVLGLPPGKVDLSEKSQTAFKSILEDLSVQRDSIIQNMLQAAGNSPSVVNEGLQKRLAVINAKGAIIREILGFPQDKVDLPKGSKERLTAILNEELPQQKARTIEELLNNASTGNSVVRAEFLSRLSKINAKGTVLREALGLPKGTADLSEKSQTAFKSMLGDLSVQKDSLIQAMLRAAGTSAMEELQKELSVIDSKINILEEVLGIKE